MDLDAVRTFVAVADAGRFQDAAGALSLTQQAVSKRIAALERDLGVPLFARTPRGARLTVDGQALLPHARELLRVEARAEASVRADRRALRVDVVSRRIAPAVRLQAFHRAHPEIELDVVTMAVNVHAALAALEAGTIDVLGPAFGNEALMDELADSAELATFAGEGTRYLWPDRYDLRRIPVRDPTPVYPMSLIWRADNAHPALAELRDFLVATRPDHGGAELWRPRWG